MHSPLDVFTKMAAWGQVLAAVASIVGLYAIWDQVRIGRKSADLQALQSFVQATMDREAALLREGISDAAREQAFIEWLNFLETYAGAINGRLCHGVSGKLIRDKLVTSIAVVKVFAAWAQKVEAAVSTDTTFAELSLFMRRNRPAISMAVMSLTASGLLRSQSRSGPS